MTDRIKQQVLAGFMTEPNVGLLASEIKKRFARPDVIIPQLPELMDHHKHRAWRELEIDDPIERSATGNAVSEMILVQNAKFLGNLTTYFEQKVPVAYSINDGHSTANGVYLGRDIQSLPPDQMLKAWRNRQGRQITLRDDTQDRGSEFGKRQAVGYGSPYSSHSPFNSPGNGNVGGRPSQPSTGVVFCDQSAVGLNEYQDYWMNRPEMRAMNDWSRPFYREADFGGTMADEDAKAFTQRIMSSYDPGSQDGAIPSYRRWLHGRNYERDTDETFAGPQNDFVQRGFDRRSMLNRITNIRAASADDNYQSLARRGTLNPPSPEMPMWQ